MNAQTAIKPNPLLLYRGIYGIVMRGVQNCTRGSSLKGRKSAPLCYIKLDTAKDATMGSGSLLHNAKRYSREAGKVSYFGQELNTATNNLARMNMILHEAIESQFLHNANLLNMLNQLRSLAKTRRVFERA